MLNYCFHRGICEVTIVVCSEKEVSLEGTARKEIIKAEYSVMVSEEMEGAMGYKGKNTEPQLQGEPHEGTNGHNPDRSILNFIQRWDF